MAATFIFSEKERAVTEWINPTSYNFELGSRQEMTDTIKNFNPNLFHYWKQLLLECEIADPNTLDDADLAVLIRNTVTRCDNFERSSTKEPEGFPKPNDSQLTPTVLRSEIENLARSQKLKAALISTIRIAS